MKRRLYTRLALCALALAVCIGIAAALVITKNQCKAQEAAAAASLAAAQAQADQAADDAAAQAAEQERLAAEAAARRAEQVAAAQNAHDTTQDGDAIGRVWVEGTQVDCDLYWGDAGSQFDKGAGAHAADGCVLPGENGTVFVGAHTGTYFSDLGSTQIGAVIHLETPWGTFDYKVTDMQVIQETDIDKVRWGAEEPSCILYTCYPFGTLTPTPQRYAVYADPIAADEYGVIPSDTTAE